MREQKKRKRGKKGRQRAEEEKREKKGKQERSATEAPMRVRRITLLLVLACGQASAAPLLEDNLEDSEALSKALLPTTLARRITPLGHD